VAVGLQRQARQGRRLAPALGAEVEAHRLEEVRARRLPLRAVEVDAGRQGPAAEVRRPPWCPSTAG